MEIKIHKPYHDGENGKGKIFIGYYFVDFFAQRLCGGILLYKQRGEVAFQKFISLIYYNFVAVFVVFFFKRSD